MASPLIPIHDPPKSHTGSQSSTSEAATTLMRQDETTRAAVRCSCGHSDRSHFIGSTDIKGPCGVCSCMEWLPEEPTESRLTSTAPHGEPGLTGSPPSSERAYSDYGCISGRSPVETSEHRDTARLRWLANTVLCTDYGDNTHPNKLIGWRVMEFSAPVIYGKTLEEAIDAGMDDEFHRRRTRRVKPPIEDLEKILKSEDSTPVQILPDGSVREITPEEPTATTEPPQSA